MYNIFKYLENKKGKQIPLKYKLINNLPLNENELTHNGNLYLFYSKIITLPNNLTVNRSLYLNNNKIITLPNNLTVNRHLDISITEISELPDDLIVKGFLFCYDTPLAERIKNDSSLLTKYSKQIKGEIEYEKHLSISV